MSKKENKRFTDKDRKTAPKRGGKNRRDYGDSYSYEPKRGSSQGRSASTGRGRSADRGYGAGRSGEGGGRGPAGRGGAHYEEAGRGRSTDRGYGAGRSGEGSGRSQSSNRGYSTGGRGQTGRAHPADFGGRGQTGRAHPADFGGRGQSGRAHPAGTGRGTQSGRERNARRVLGFDMTDPYKDDAFIGSDGLEVIAGRNPVTEALNGSREVERVFIADGAEGSVSKIVAIAREQGVIVDFVPKEKIDAMAPGVKHQGVVCKVSEYRYADLEEVFEKADASGEDPFIIILDEVTDPHNLGAIIRTAECAGAHGVIIPKRRAASLTQTVALSAAGAIENMPVVQVTNLARTIEELKERGVWVGAADMDGETYYKANLTGAIAIVIGNEGKGVGRLVKEKCDFVLSIPMYGSINSLNASNAAAVLMYGIRRARSEKR